MSSNYVHVKTPWSFQWRNFSFQYFRIEKKNSFEFTSKDCIHEFSILPSTAKHQAIGWWWWWWCICDCGLNNERFLRSVRLQRKRIHCFLRCLISYKSYLLFEFSLCIWLYFHFSIVTGSKVLKAFWYCYYWCVNDAVLLLLLIDNMSKFALPE